NWVHGSDRAGFAGSESRYECEIHNVPSERMATVARRPRTAWAQLAPGSKEFPPSLCQRPPRNDWAMAERRGKETRRSDHSLPSGKTMAMPLGLPRRSGAPDCKERRGGPWGGSLGVSHSHARWKVNSIRAKARTAAPASVSKLRRHIDHDSGAPVRLR